jgi:hypothetical protein
MSTWKCPKCGAKNPAPIHSRPEITCAACAESFSTQYSTKSPAPIKTILAPQVIHNECFIPKIKKKLSINSFSNQDEWYKINLNNLSCTCPDWQDLRKEYPHDSLNRCCKHIIKSLAELPSNIYPEWLYNLIVDTSKLKKGLNAHAKYELKLVDSSYILYSFTENDWINISFYGNGYYQRYGYNKLKNRWANDKKPANHQIYLIGIISNDENVSKSENKIDSSEIISHQNTTQNKSTNNLKFWKLWLKSTAWVFGIGCFIGYISDGSGNALAVAVGSYLIKAPILGYLIARVIKYRSKKHYE